MQKQETLAISSEALRLSFTSPPPIQQELVISDPNQLQKIDWQKFLGIHFRVKRGLKTARMTDQQREDEFYQKLTEVISIAGERNMAYVTIHLEDLPDDESKAKSWLEELNKLAQEKRIILLLENVEPRVDRQLQPWQYSLIEFFKKFEDELARWQNIGFCLDIAHLGLGEPEVIDLLGKVFEAKLSGINNLEKVLNDDEQELWLNFQEVMQRTATIHWSRARRKTSKSLFEKLSKISQKLKPVSPLIHQGFTLLKNVFSAHYSLASDSNFFAMITTMLQELGWQGTVVIESPDILEMLRERHLPHKREIGLLA